MRVAANEEKATEQVTEEALLSDNRVQLHLNKHMNKELISEAGIPLLIRPGDLIKATTSSGVLMIVRKRSIKLCPGNSRENQVHHSFCRQLSSAVIWYVQCSEDSILEIFLRALDLFQLRNYRMIVFRKKNRSIQKWGTSLTFQTAQAIWTMRHTRALLMLISSKNDMKEE